MLASLALGANKDKYIIFVPQQAEEIHIGKCQELIEKTICNYRIFFLSLKVVIKAKLYQLVTVM